MRFAFNSAPKGENVSDDTNSQDHEDAIAAAEDQSKQTDKNNAKGEIKRTTDDLRKNTGQ